MQDSTTEISPLLLDHIYTGDALATLRTLPDGCIDAVITDPPYNMTNLAFEQAIDWQSWWKEVQRVRRSKNTPIVLFSQQPFTTDLILSNHREWRYELIWAKTMPVGYLDAKRRPLRCHENIQVFSAAQANYYPVMSNAETKRATSRKNGKRSEHYNDNANLPVIWKDSGLRYPRSVMTYAQRDTAFQQTNTYHPTAKPLALMEYLLQLFSKEGNVVLDCFCGSGSTAVAARKLDRRYIACDVDQHWVDVALQRLRDTDPFQHRQTADGVQLSMFASLGGAE